MVKHNNIFRQKQVWWDEFEVFLQMFKHYRIKVTHFIYNAWCVNDITEDCRVLLTGCPAGEGMLHIGFLWLNISAFFNLWPVCVCCDCFRCLRGSTESRLRLRLCLMSTAASTQRLKPCTQWQWQFVFDVQWRLWNISSEGYNTKIKYFLWLYKIFMLFTVCILWHIHYITSLFLFI